MDNQLPTTTVNANGVEIAYELYGNPDDPVIFLIHGLGMPMTSWPKAMVDKLVASGFQVLRIDNRDQGRSQKFDNLPMPNMIWQILKLKFGLKVNAPYPLTDLMSDTMGVLDALNITEAHLVGVSMGGMISQLVAINAPSRVKSLTSIMSTTGNPKLPRAKKEVVDHLMSRTPLKTQDDIVNYHVRTWQLIGSPAYPTKTEQLKAYVREQLDRGISPMGTTRQLLAILGTHNRFSELKSLSMPVQVIHGTHDPLIPVAAGKETAQAIEHAKLHLIQGMGHDLPEQLHDDLCDLIIKQAKEVELKLIPA